MTMRKVALSETIDPTQERISVSFCLSAAAVSRLNPVVFVCCILLAISCDECFGCSHKDSIATLSSQKGRNEFDRAKTKEKWNRVIVGHDFFFGDGLRTGSKGSATVRLLDGSLLKLGPETQVRFRKTKGVAQRTAAFDVVTGEAILEVGAQELRLEMGVGLAVIEPTSRLQIKSGEAQGVELVVTVGNVVFEEGDTQRQLEVGDSIRIAIGGVVLEEDYGDENANTEDDPINEELETGSVSVNIVGRGVKVRRPGQKEWSSLGPGEQTLQVDTELRLPRRTRAEIRRGKQQGTIFGPGNAVMGTKEGGLLSASGGSIDFQAREENTAIVVPGGVIIARADAPGGSSGALTIRGRLGDELKVNEGRVDVRTQFGTETVAAGNELTIGGEDLEEFGKIPERVVFTAPAGESFFVRDPSPPTALGIRTASKCAAGGIFRLYSGKKLRASIRAQAVAKVTVPPGSYRYELRCIEGSGVTDSSVARGSVTVMRDSGKASLPKTAPDSLIEVDGRRYTILYQNLLPSVTVRWRNAPQSSKYTLDVTSGGKSQSLSSSTPKFQFESGSLGEGVHRVSMRAEGAEKASKVSNLMIRFDNAAPKASVQQPENGSFSPGATVQVAGVAMKDWTVAVGGTTIPQDSQHRFSASMVVPAEHDGVAIRIAHPKRGVNYYLRRAGGE